MKSTLFYILYIFVRVKIESIKMVLGNYNNMNMFGMGRMFGMGSSFGTNNLVSELFSGTNSIFNAGCFGGGSNFFGGISNMFNGGMSGLFGCNGSFFTNCNGSMNYGAMAGFGVANVLLGFGGQIINQAIANKQEYSEKTVQADIKEIDKQINEQVKKLGCDSVSEALKCTVDPEIQKAYDDANTNFNKALQDISTKKQQLGRIENSLPAAEEAVKNSSPEDKNYDNLKKHLENLKNMQTKVKNEIAELEKKTTENGELFEAKKTAENNLNAEKEKVKTAQAEIRRLQDAKANAQNMLNKKKLDSFDGNRFQRTSFEELKAMFDENGNLKSDQKVSKSDIRAAIKGYRTATNDSERKDWKAKFEKLWADFDPEDRTSDLRSAYNIICG